MRVTTWVLAGVTTVASTGCAGRVATTFADVQRRAPAGTTIYVTPHDGPKVKGRLTSVSGSTIKVSLHDAATQEFSEADVARIDARDGVWNGLVIGAALGGFFTFALNDASCIAPYASPDCKKVSRGQGVAIGTALGAALGAGFDVLRHRKVFRGTAPSHGASIFITPLITPRTAAVTFSARF